jgi:hypothetical protein
MLLFCSETHADCDDFDSKLSTNDYFNEHEEEYRHRVQLEAEERKLEETLKYQRRIEEEAKEKHLADQFKSTYASSVIEAAAHSKTVNLIRGQDNHEHAPNHSPSAYLEGMKFGDFRFSEGYLREEHSSSGTCDMNLLQNTENGLRGKYNGWHSPEAEALTSNDMAISNMNGVWKNAQHIKSSGNPGIQRPKKGTIEPQKKCAQGCWLSLVRAIAFTINFIYNLKLNVCLLLQVCPVLYMMMVEHLVHSLVLQLVNGVLQVK